MLPINDHLLICTIFCAAANRMTIDLFLRILEQEVSSGEAFVERVEQVTYAGPFPHKRTLKVRKAQGAHIDLLDQVVDWRRFTGKSLSRLRHENFLPCNLMLRSRANAPQCICDFALAQHV